MFELEKITMLTIQNRISATSFYHTDLQYYRKQITFFIALKTYRDLIPQ